MLPQRFPGSTFSFLPADIVSQMLNFGSPAPIDVQVAGPDKAKDEAYAAELRRRIAGIPGRRRRPAAAILALSRIRRWMWTAPAPGRSASPSATSPTAWWSIWRAASRSRRPIWLNPKNGVSYPIVIQTPQYRMDTLGDLEKSRSPAPSPAAARSWAASATSSAQNSDAVVSHYAIQPVFDVYAATQDRDLGGVASCHPDRA